MGGNKGIMMKIMLFIVCEHVDSKIRARCLKVASSSRNNLTGELGESWKYKVYAGGREDEQGEGGKMGKGRDGKWAWEGREEGQGDPLARGPR